MDTTHAATPIPGVAQITYPDGTSEYRYTDELQAAIDRAEAVGYAPVVQPAPQPSLPAAPAERPALIEPWMVRVAFGLGTAAGVVALAGPAEAAAAELSASAGYLLHMAMELGGAALVVYVLLRLLVTRKTGAGQQIEVVQTVTQTITNVVRIGE